MTKEARWLVKSRESPPPQVCQMQCIDDLASVPRRLALQGWDLTIKRPDFSMPVMRSVKEMFPNLKELILKGVQYESKLLGNSPVMSPLLSRYVGH
eukprot:1136304-Pelagomonas_calceolata.AAC.2